MNGIIRPCTEADAERIAEIYNYYVEKTTITFEEVAVSTEEMLKRINKVKDGYEWFVYEADGIVWGYAYLHQWHSRAAYRNTAETSTYIAHDFPGRGAGSMLYGKLVETGREMGLHALIASISLPNDASIKMQKRFDFEQVAHYREVGYKFDQWIDVVNWQLIL